jgi:gas vesicle protein
MFFSFLSGAAIGAGLALLFAPQSGKETRRQIKDFSEKLGSEVKDNVEKISEKAMDFIEGTKDSFKKKSRV